MKRLISLVLAGLIGLMLIGDPMAIRDEKEIVPNEMLENNDYVIIEAENTQEPIMQLTEEQDCVTNIIDDQDDFDEIQDDWPEIMPEELKKEWEEHAILTEIVIVMTHEASMDLKYYSVEDFPEIECTSVQNLNTAALETIKNAEKGTKEADGFVGFGEYKSIVRLFFNSVSVEELYQAIVVLNRRSDVEIAGPCMRTNVELCSTTPNDQYYSNQWALNKISAPAAWDLCKKAKDVKIAIIDGGIDVNHLDLSGNIINSECCCIGPSLFNSNETAVLPDNSPSDVADHGTRVAGIIGAEGNNLIGISGLCWETNIASYNIFGYNAGTAYVDNYTNLAMLIDQASSNGCELINICVTWNPLYLTSAQISACEAAINNFPGLIICAAGNNGLNVGTFSFYPCEHRTSNMIVVGASTNSDTVASYSNYSSTDVDLFAPGGVYLQAPTIAADTILLTRATSYCANDPTLDVTHLATGYHYGTGTSFAAPYVTATAALLMSYYTTMTPAQVKAAILNNVDTISALSGYCVTGGRLNVYAALSNP